MPEKDEPKYPDIDLSAMICQMIKNAFFASRAWGDCYQQVADHFTLIKKNARKEYGHDDILPILIEFDESSIKRFV